MKLSFCCVSVCSLFCVPLFWPTRRNNFHIATRLIGTIQNHEFSTHNNNNNNHNRTKTLTRKIAKTVTPITDRHPMNPRGLFPNVLANLDRFFHSASLLIFCRSFDLSHTRSSEVNLGTLISLGCVFVKLRWGILIFKSWMPLKGCRCVSRVALFVILVSIIIVDVIVVSRHYRDAEPRTPDGDALFLLEMHHLEPP